MDIVDCGIVLVFGVFDRLHPGHEYFLKEAMKYGVVHVCLASDGSVMVLKSKTPQYSFTQRANAIQEKFPNIVVHRGDDTIGQWSIFNKVKPNIIILGHDQENLHKALIKSGYVSKNTKYIMIDAFYPDMYKTSLLA